MLKVETMHAEMSGEQFLDACEAAVEAQDRSAVARLSTLAFAKRNVKWQAAIRHVDNYLIAVQQGNEDLQELCQKALSKLVPDIRKD
jgi:hypothetical protein